MNGRAFIQGTGGGSLKPNTEKQKISLAEGIMAKKGDLLYGIKRKLNWQYIKLQGLDNASSIRAIPYYTTGNGNAVSSSANSKYLAIHAITGTTANTRRIYVFTRDDSDPYTYNYLGSTPAASNTVVSSILQFSVTNAGDVLAMLAADNNYVRCVAYYNDGSNNYIQGTISNMVYTNYGGPYNIEDGTYFNEVTSRFYAGAWYNTSSYNCYLGHALYNQTNHTFTFNSDNYFLGSNYFHSAGFSKNKNNDACFNFRSQAWIDNATRNTSNSVPIDSYNGRYITSIGYASGAIVRGIILKNEPYDKYVCMLGLNYNGTYKYHGLWGDSSTSVAVKSPITNSFGYTQSIFEIEKDIWGYYYSGTIGIRTLDGTPIIDNQSITTNDVIRSYGVCSLANEVNTLMLLFSRYNYTTSPALDGEAIMICIPEYEYTNDISDITDFKMVTSQAIATSSGTGTIDAYILTRSNNGWLF